MQNNSKITPEGVLETLDATLKKFAAEAAERAAERAAEADRRAAEFDQRLEKSRAEAAERAAEAKKFDEEFKLKTQEIRDMHADIAIFLKKLGQQIGGVSNSNGDMAEEFFFNALYHGKREMFGEKFDDVIKDIKVGFRGYEDQYDVVLMNGRSTCVVEVKYKADSADLPPKVIRKAQTFRQNFPQHSAKKLFLALAAMSIHPLTEQACIDNGIAIIKQLGDTIVIHDESLKTF